MPIDGGEHMLVLPEMMATVPPYYQDTYIKAAYAEYCVEIGTEYGICPELLMALIEKESSGHADAQNGTCKGLCQVSEKWHRDRMEKLGVTDIFDPEGNIMLAADYLMELEAEYEDIGLCLMIYNGSSNAVSMAERGELTEYADWILTRSEELERANGK